MNIYDQVIYVSVFLEFTEPRYHPTSYTMSGNFGFSAFAHVEQHNQNSTGRPHLNAATDGSLGQHVGKKNPHVQCARLTHQACIGHRKPATEADRVAIKIGRARLAGPTQVTKDATVAEIGQDGKINVLAIGTNGWVCFPGDENEIGNVPMACDPMGLQWVKDLVDGKPAPTNKAPGIIYMLCGATQRSVSSPFDNTSSAIPIGPHYMIIWPFDAEKSGFPTNVRDAGAWVMFDKTPWSHLHVCGSPWDGTVYHPEKAPNPIWSLRYVTSNEDSEQSGF